MDWTPEAIRDFRVNVMRETQTEFGARIGVKKWAVMSWENGYKKPYMKRQRMMTYLKNGLNPMTGHPYRCDGHHLCDGRLIYCSGKESR